MIKKLYASRWVLILRLISRLSLSLIIALLCALVFEMQDSYDLSIPMPVQTAYFRALLFCIPMALSFYAAEKIRYLWLYCIASAAICAIAWLLLGHVGGIGIAALVCLLRAIRRVSEEQSDEFVLDRPYLLALVIFAAVFVISAFQGYSITQKLCVISAALYFLLAISYDGILRIEDYIALNVDRAGVPVKRIRRIAGGALLAAVILASILLIPPAVGVSGEFRMSLPQSSSHGSYEATSTSVSTQGLKMSEIFGDGSSWQIPKFVSDVLFAVCIAGVAVLFLYAIYRIIRNFRGSFTDSRDVVTYLDNKEDKADDRVKREKRPRILDRSPNAAIRRRYRKTLLRASKDALRRWQTPEELEKAAGIDAPKLHELYEKARYSNMPCTDEELRSLKK